MNTTTPEAFGERVAECRSYVLRFVRRKVYASYDVRVRNREFAEDVTQDTMVTAIEMQHRFSGEINDQTFRSWLCGIAHNILRNQRRYETYRMMISTDEPKREDERGERARIELACPRPDPFAVLLQREKERETAELLPEVKTQLDALSPRARECIQLHYLDGMSSRQIAERLGLSCETVKVHLFRGVKRMRAPKKPKPEKIKTPAMRAAQLRRKSIQAQSQRSNDETAELYRRLVARGVLLPEKGAA